MDPQELLKQAARKASGSTSFLNRWMGTSGDEKSDAADLYIQAGNAFRLQKDARSAGGAFEIAAKLQKESDARDEASNTLIEAYKAYRGVDPAQAAKTLQEAIHLFTLRGQFRRAAQYEMDLGSLYEELDDDEKALEAYENAGDWYFNDRAESLSNKAFLKVAELAGLRKNYKVAVQNFERVARQSLNSNLSKWSLKEYFMKATLCHLAQGDAIDAGLALEKYVEQDPTFESTREYQFLNGLVEAVKEQDEESFTNRLYEYDQFAKLDKFCVAVCLKIKDVFAPKDDELL